MQTRLTVFSLFEIAGTHASDDRLVCYSRDFLTLKHHRGGFAFFLFCNSFFWWGGVRGWVWGFEWWDGGGGGGEGVL